MVPRRRAPWYAKLTGQQIATTVVALSTLAGSIHGDRKTEGVDDRVTAALAWVKNTSERADSLDAKVKFMTARVRALERGKKLAEHPELYLVGPPVPPKPKPWWNPFRKEG